MWWIAGIAGLLIGCAVPGYSNTFGMIVGAMAGSILGLMADKVWKARLRNQSNENLELHQKAASLIFELRDKITQLENKNKQLEKQVAQLGLHKHVSERTDTSNENTTYTTDVHAKADSQASITSDLNLHLNENQQHSGHNAVRYQLHDKNRDQASSTQATQMQQEDDVQNTHQSPAATHTSPSVSSPATMNSGNTEQELDQALQSIALQAQGEAKLVLSLEVSSTPTTTETSSAQSEVELSLLPLEQTPIAEDVKDSVGNKLDLQEKIAPTENATHNASPADINAPWLNDQPTSTSGATTSKASSQSSQSRQARQTEQPIAASKGLRDYLPESVANFIFGANTLVKIGVLILFLGFAFLIRYAAERVTVPMELRYAGVTLAAVFFLGLGWKLREKRREYGLLMQAMGVGVLYLVSFAAMKIHGLIDPSMGFIFLFAVSILAGLLAILQKAQPMAVAAALQGFAVPILASTGSNNPVGLFTYLAILDLGILMMAWFNAWRALNIIAFVGTTFLAGGWAQKYYTDEQYSITQTALIGFFVLFAIIGVLFARRTLQDAKTEAQLKTIQDEQGHSLARLKLVGRVDSALTFGNPLTAMGFQYVMLKHTEYGAAISALCFGLFYIVLARFVFSRDKSGLRLLAEAYAIVAVLFGTLAIPLGLQGEWTSAAWAIEGAGMYWLGCRQHRPYSRLFAFAVIIGSAYKLWMSLQLNLDPSMPFLRGAILGPIFFGVSALVMGFLARRYEAEHTDEQRQWESLANPILPWLGLYGLSLLPWMLFEATYAIAITSVIGLFVSQQMYRLNLAQLRLIGASLQVLAVVCFGLILHTNNDTQGMTQAAYFQNGWAGLITGIILAASIFLNAGRHMFVKKREALVARTLPDWAWYNTIGMMVAMSIVQLCFLFGLSLTQSAAIWPITAYGFLLVAIWMAHRGMAAFSFIWQLIVIVVYAHQYPDLQGEVFNNYKFFIPLSLSIAAWLSADKIRAENSKVQKTRALETRAAQSELTVPDVFAWVNQWCAHPFSLWAGIIIGWICGIIAWYPEVWQAVSMQGKSQYLPVAILGLTVAIGAGMLWLAKWRNWPQMAGVSVSHLWLIIYSFFIGSYLFESDYVPSRYLGWLMWPLAFLFAVWMLRTQEKYFAERKIWLSINHSLFGWFFVFLAAFQLARSGASYVEADSAWLSVLWAIAPTAYLWWVVQKKSQTQWPIQTMPTTYRFVIATPLLLWLSAWFISAVLNHSGYAAPLPYITVLNPLEVMLLIVLTSIATWWFKTVHVADAKGGETTAYDKMILVGFGVAVFLWITTTVLRSVHHFADVPWDGSALFESKLAQASVSITWAVLGVSAMILGNKKALRVLWMAGAALIALVVAKLFIVELKDSGGLYRIISFIVVGILILIVGYFAPLPTQATQEEKAKPV